MADCYGPNVFVLRKDKKREYKTINGHYGVMADDEDMKDICGQLGMEYTLGNEK